MALRGYIFTQNSSSFSSSVAVSATAGWTGSAPQSGDIVVAYVTVGNSGSHGSNTVTPPSGFAAVTGATNGINVDAGAHFLSCYYKVAGTESGSYTFNFQFTGDLNTLLVVAYSGRNTSSPITAASTTGPTARAGSSPTNFSVTGLTAANGDDILYFIDGNNGITSDTTKTFSPPSGYGNNTLQWTNNAAPIFMFADKESVSSGATGTLGGSLTLSPSGNAVAYAGYVISLAAPSQINVVQETSSTGGSGTSVALAYVSNITVGSSGHCVVRAQTSTSFSITDSKSNTWTQRGPVLNDGGGRNYAHFTCDNMVAGATTVTATLSPSGASVAMWIREIGLTSGFDTHAEQVQAAYSSAATDGVTAGVQAPSVTPGLISGFSAIAINTPPVLAAGTGFTGDIVPWGSNSGLSQHKRYTGAIVNLAATWTASTSATTVPVSFAAYFKESGASAPTVLAGAATPTSGGTTTSLSTGSFNTRDTVANTAAFSGFVTSLNLYVNSIGTGVVLYLALYDTSNNLLCEGQINLSVGLNTIGIANGPFLTSGQSYWIGAQSDGTVVPADDSGVSKKNLITNAVLPPPTGLIFPGSTVTGGRMTLWAAGIAGTVPTSPLYHRRNTLYFIN